MMQVSDEMLRAAFDASGHQPTEYNTTWMRAALEAALAAMWRDISTAPKDGTYVLVWRPDEGDCHHEAHVGIDTWSGKSWYRSRLNQQPTAWMPLPQPPRHKEG
jgi:hypothetical protein